ncbi:MAG: hypothetical protein ACAI44_36910 [Candidatus Sericytochromatia bacterium]
MTHKRPGLWLILTFLLLSGCYSVTLDARYLDGAISLNDQPQRARLKHFRVQSTSHHLIYGLVEIAKPDIAGEIAKEVRAAGGGGAVNVTFKTEFSFLDLVLNWLTAGIYNPVTVVAEGDVIAAE